MLAEKGQEHQVMNIAGECIEPLKEQVQHFEDHQNAVVGFDSVLPVYVTQVGYAVDEGLSWAFVNFSDTFLSLCELRSN
jgi:hypothetical protein